MLAGTDESYWMDSTPTTTYPALTGDLEVDVVVVGGGIAGLGTAWELTEAGWRVALVEADRIAAGVTGYTTAKLSVPHTPACRSRWPAPSGWRTRPSSTPADTCSPWRRT